MTYNFTNGNKNVMPHTVDENGFIHIKDNPISKSGVFQYLGKNISPDLEPDKVYDVWRPEEELNNPETIESFKLSPWIPYHEMLGDKYTNAEEVGVQGVTGEDVYFKDGTLYSNLKLFGNDLKQSIKDGLKELSCGFGCVWQVISGTTPDGKPYDAIQKRIRGNHLASVPNGRMGKQVAVAMDRVIFALDNLNLEPKPNGDIMTLEEAMAKIKELEAQIAKDKQSAQDAKEAEDLEKEKLNKEKAAKDKKPEKGVDPFPEKGDKKDGEKSGMDSAILTAINTLTETVTAQGEEIKTIKSSALDANSVVKALSDKNALADKAAAVVGAFDHSDMDKQAVAKYALDKIGMACDSGQEISTLNGYLAARKQPNFVVDHGQDEATDSHSKALGL